MPDPNYYPRKDSQILPPSSSSKNGEDQEVEPQGFWEKWREENNITND